MNIPNFLSLLRIILVPLLVIFLINKAFLKALILFTALGVTDALDGFLARILKQQTVLGSYLDPIADKILITSCFLALAILKVIPGWLAVIVISRSFSLYPYPSIRYLPVPCLSFSLFQSTQGSRSSSSVKSRG